MRHSSHHPHAHPGSISVLARVTAELQQKQYGQSAPQSISKRNHIHDMQNVARPSPLSFSMFPSLPRFLTSNLLFESHGKNSRSTPVLKHCYTTVTVALAFDA